MSNKTKKGREKVVLEPREINKINLLWFLNGWNITNIARTMRRSAPVCERHIFESHQEWDKWSDRMAADGQL